MAEVHLEQVTKRYGDTRAVSDMTWTACQGEFVVLFGPSGAGKTTTLKMIAGLEDPSGGEIRFNGRSMAGVDTADRNVAMAFENYALYPHMSVFENIAFPMKVPGRRALSNDEIRKRVADVAAVLQIETLLDRKPQQLSGGQRQRVALGRCLVREPEVCLLDEPIAHLDAKLRHRMYAELKRIQRKRGTTTLYATPAQTEAVAMADRIVIVFEGAVQQIASPRELYERPGSVAIARFGGEQPMNILPIELVRDGGRLGFTLAGQCITAPDCLAALVDKHQISDKVLLGVRPPDIELAAPGPAGDVVQGTMYAVEQLGRTARLTVKTGEHLIEVALKPDLTDLTAKIGDPVWLSLCEGPLYLFDAGTTRLVATSGEVAALAEAAGPYIGPGGR
jgi:multiple sugar transport system ATP-binding protein